MIPATNLAKLAKGTVIGVQVPANMDVKKAMKECKKIEKTLNSKIGIDKNNQKLTIANIMSSAGKLKVVPIFGDKGRLEKLDYKPDESDNMLSNITDLREVICTSIGFPYELLFKSDGDAKGTLLKRYARYLRRLRAVRRAAIEGIKQIINIHLVAKGIDFVPTKDIQINFRTKLLNINNTEYLEYADTSAGMIGNLIDLIDAVKTQFGEEVINLEEFAKFVDTHFKVIGMDNIIDVKKVGKEPVPPPEPEEEPETEPETELGAETEPEKEPEEAEPEIEKEGEKPEVEKEEEK
jgi:hypothetical protein